MALQGFSTSQSCPPFLNFYNPLESWSENSPVIIPLAPSKIYTITSLTKVAGHEARFSALLPFLSAEHSTEVWNDYKNL